MPGIYYAIVEGEGRTVADAYYTLCMPDGKLIHGITDRAGRIGWHVTDSARNLAVYLGHKE